MIKLILHMGLLVMVTNFADYQKPVTFSSVFNYAEKKKNTHDSLAIFIKSLTETPIINLPYGDKNILKKFPAEWKLADYKNTPQSKAIQNLQHAYNSLDSFFYADAENENRVVTKADRYIAEKFVSADFIHFDDTIKINKKIPVRAVQLQLSNTFKTYSLIVSGTRACTNCEFITRQTENILINTDKQNRIIDKLLLSSVTGNDLGSYSKFFFIDKSKIIHLKEFSNDELTSGFVKYSRYKVMADGHFVKHRHK